MRWMSLGGVVSAVLALGVLAGPAMAAAPAAAPNPQNVKAARAVVRDETRYNETALRRGGAMTAAARAMVAQVKAGCAGGIPASLASGTKKQQAVVFDLLFEGAFDLSLAVDRPIEAPTVNLSKRLAHIRFATRAFTRGIRQVAKMDRVLIGFAPSDLCTDVKAAGANGFTADPPGTKRILKSLGRLLETAIAPAPKVLKKLKSFLVTGPDKAALKRLKALGNRADAFSSKLSAKWSTKLGAVLTPPAPAGGTGGFPTSPPPPGPTGALRRLGMASAFAAL